MCPLIASLTSKLQDLLDFRLHLHHKIDRNPLALDHNFHASSPKMMRTSILAAFAALVTMASARNLLSARKLHVRLLLRTLFHGFFW